LAEGASPLGCCGFRLELLSESGECSAVMLV
jgi:hypothetical protein